MTQSKPDISAGKQILVVDDNLMNRDLLSRRLMRKGLEVAVAEDGYRALDWLQENPCDLVLLDIMMPGMSGIEVLETLRETRDTAELPIIMVTAKDTRDDIVGALQSGANDYVTKPIDFPVVLARVRTQLALKHAHDEIERRNEFIRSVFGRYLTDEVADTLLASPEALSLGGERREISILMADIRGFTQLSASHDAEEVMQVVNNFLSRMTDVIQRYGGTIDEFIGDAILVLFGAPGRMDHHAENAVACAIEMQGAMRDVNRANEAIGLGPIQTGIGISTGEVIVGNIGSEKRAKYGVVGHNVILAARIQSETEGGQVIVSRASHDACRGILEIGDERTVRLKGFDHDVKLFNVVGIGGRHNVRLPND